MNQKLSSWCLYLSVSQLFPTKIVSISHTVSLYSSFLWSKHQYFVINKMAMSVKCPSDPCNATVCYAMMLPKPHSSGTAMLPRMCRLEMSTRWQIFMFPTVEIIAQTFFWTTPRSAKWSPHSSAIFHNGSTFQCLVWLGSLLSDSLKPEVMKLNLTHYHIIQNAFKLKWEYTYCV